MKGEHSRRDNKQKPDPDSPTLKPLSEQAKTQHAEFLRRLGTQRQVARSVSLTILVWGPSPSAATPESKKRIEICNALRDAGHNAQFSEDVRLDDADDISLQTMEFDHAISADLVVLLPSSPGSIGELCNHSNYTRIASKLLVFVDAAHASSGGYIESGTVRELASGYGGLHHYTQAELAACSVLTQTMARARVLREIEYRRREGFLR